MALAMRCVCLTVALAFGGVPAADVPAAPAAATVAELIQLYKARDFFALEERVAEASDLSPALDAFFHAALLHAFNQPRASNEALQSIFDGRGLPDDLALDAWRIKLANHVRLSEYAAAHDAAARALALPQAGADPEAAEDLRNMVRMTGALRDVPPMEIEIAGDTLLEPVDGRVALRIEGKERRFLVDTGANFSVLMRSEAEALGLEIREAGIEVGTSTDLDVHADLAVADRLELGKVRYRNVLFLVFPDELLTIPGGPRLAGLVGFPLLEAVGEVRFRKDGTLLLPAHATPTAERNLALDQLEPLVRVRYGQDAMVCRLDTGANSTDFYEPFYRRHRREIESRGQRVKARTAGVGGMRELDAYRLGRIDLTLGGRTTTLHDVDVYVEPITEGEDNDLYCNIGLDLLQQYEEYRLNFRSMGFVFRAD